MILPYEDHRGRRPPAGRLWQCKDPACQRIEKAFIRSPRCTGTPEAPHARSECQPIPDRLGPPTDERRLWR